MCRPKRSCAASGRGAPTQRLILLLAVPLFFSLVRLNHLTLNEEGSDTLIIVDREASYHRPRFSEEIEQAPKIAIFGSPSAAGLVGSVIRTLTLSDGNVHFVNNISDLHFTRPAVIWLLDGSDDSDEALVRSFCAEHSIGLLILRGTGTQKEKTRRRTHSIRYGPHAKQFLHILKYKASAVELSQDVEFCALEQRNNTTQILIEDEISGAPFAIQRNDNRVVELCTVSKSDHWLVSAFIVDALHFLSFGKLAVPLERKFGVDIDDIFGPDKLETAEDVEDLISTQRFVAQRVPGFRFHLGFNCDRYDPLRPADKLLVKHANSFSWFDHLPNHELMHELKAVESETDLLSMLQIRMERSIGFSRVNGIFTNIAPGYSVSPMHSGEYPPLPELYRAWKTKWNVTSSTTYTYPSSGGDYRAIQGFKFANVFVAPRQKIGLFTKHKRYSDLHFEEVTNKLRGGAVWMALLEKPVSIFMTHAQNFGSDHLANDSIRRLIHFTTTYTNLILEGGPHDKLVQKHFEIFPNDSKETLLYDPCRYKEMKQIWWGNCVKDKSSGSGTGEVSTNLPRVIIIGPQKTGTTALMEFFKVHPAAIPSLSHPKYFEELQFFSQSSEYEKGLHHYLSFFPETNSSTSWTYEKSASYFHSLEAPHRIHAAMPKVRLVCILRDPIDRALSWYQHEKAHGDKTAMTFSFSDVALLTDPNNKQLKDLRKRCLGSSLYSHHLSRWLEAGFERSQILLLDGDKIIRDPSQEMMILQDFLGLKGNSSVDYRKLLTFNEEKGYYCLAHGKKKCLGRGKGRQYDKILAPEVMASLRSYFREDVLELEKELKGLQFWSSRLSLGSFEWVDKYKQIP